jgi:hypothetical protein
LDAILRSRGRRDVAQKLEIKWLSPREASVEFGADRFLEKKQYYRSEFTKASLAAQAAREHLGKLQAEAAPDAAKIAALESEQIIKTEGGMATEELPPQGCLLRPDRRAAP